MKSHLLRLALGLAAGAIARAADVVPTDRFVVPDGLEITLWARAPLLRNPTNIDIDAAGRIWVTEGVNYRRHAGRDAAGDRVVVLEDTDGDGRADRSSVFVQEPGLVAPLGIAVIDDRVVVSNAPDLIVYTDADRNGLFDPRVDRRDVLLTGFNGRNHDHALHSLTVGPDGLWYFNHGNAGAHVTDRSGRTFRVGSTYEPIARGNATPLYGWKSPDLAGAVSDDGRVHTGGFLMRVRPDGTHAEIIGHNFRNSYEQAITSFGDVFQSDNDDEPGCRVAWVPEHGNAGFFSSDGRRYWTADRRPGQSVPVAMWHQEDPGVMPPGDIYGPGSPTGVAFYEGGALGEKWRGLLLVCEASLNVVYGYLPVPDGAGFRLERFDFITTNPERKFEGVDFTGGARSIRNQLKTFFRPSDVAVGPDGAIYVADWFDARSGGHDSLDDSLSGAIYRIAPKGFTPRVPKLDLARPADQIAALRSPAVNVRGAAFARIKARGASAVPEISALLVDPDPYLRARAVFLLAQLGPSGVGLAESELASADPQQRVAAFRALRRAGQPILAHARRLTADSSAAVRREVALAMRDVPWSESRETLLELARRYDGRDRWYLEAWGTGCTGKEADIYAALRAGQKESDATQWSPAFAGLVWRLLPAEAAADFAARARSSSLPEPGRLAAVTALGFTPTRPAAAALLELAASADGLVQEQARWWLINFHSTRWREFGVTDALRERGLYDPEGIVVVASIIPPAPPTKLPAAAEIAKLPADAARGANLATACLMCHRLGENGAEFGPNLTGFARRQTTEVVINAIVSPSAEIAHGYDGSEITLHDGTILHGLEQSTGDPLYVRTMGGATQIIPANRVKSIMPLRRSLMLSADQLGLSAQDVADIAEYLKSQ